MPNPLDDTTVTPTTPVVDGSTGSTQTTPPAVTTSTTTTPPSTPSADGTQTTTPPATQSSQTMTDEQIATLADKFLGKMAAATAKPAEQKDKPFELTPELAESLKPVRVTQQLLAGLGFEGASPEQVAAFQTFADAIVTHAAHVSSFLQQRALNELNSRLEPYAGYLDQQRAEAHRTSFFAENKDLQKYGQFVSFAASKIVPNKADGTPKTVKEISLEVANATRSLLKEAGVNLDSQNNANQGSASTSTTVPKMPSLATAGGSMSGSNQGKTGKSSIFED